MTAVVGSMKAAIRIKAMIADKRLSFFIFLPSFFLVGGNQIASTKFVNILSQ
jgi:hypothetical protein